MTPLDRNVTPVDPAITMDKFGENPCFENRLMTAFVAEKAAPGAMGAVRQGSKTVIHAPVKGSLLSLVLEGSDDTKYWQLQVRNPEGYTLAYANHQNTIGRNRVVGALEGGYLHGGLTDPYAAETMRLLADLSEMDGRTRSMETLLEGYPKITNPLTQAYINLIREYTDPARLRVAEEYVQRPPSKIAGMIEHPGLAEPSPIVLDRYSGNPSFGTTESALCYILWSGDRGEGFISPRQTAFGFAPEVGFHIDPARTYNLTPGTVRHDMSHRMLASLNEHSPLNV